MRTFAMGMVLVSSHAWADIGIEAGARAGVDFAGAQDVFVGGELRLTFPSTPLTINPTFDYFFVGDESLMQLGVNALYAPPGGLVRPYVGVGFAAARFALPLPPPMPGAPPSGPDGEGFRAGLNVLGGAYVDLPAVKPYVQAMASIGDIDLYTVSVGVLTNFGRDAPARSERSLPVEPATLVLSPYLLAHLAGDVEEHRGGAGVSLGYYRRRIGFEVDAAVHGHYFKDADLVGLIPDPLADLNTRGIVVTGNVVVPYPIQRAGLWTPYVLAGVGMARAIFDVQGADEYDTTQNDLLIDAGAGVMHALTRHVGLRVELRYAHAFVDEEAGTGGYFKDYDVLRVTVGLTVGVGL